MNYKKLRKIQLYSVLGEPTAVDFINKTYEGPMALQPADKNWSPVQPPKVTPGISVQLLGHHDLDALGKAFEFEAVVPGSVLIEYNFNSIWDMLVLRIRMKINKTLVDEGVLLPQPAESETGMKCPNCGVTLGA